MIVCKTIDEARTAIRDARKKRKKISFVPTMGALHDGHMSLLKIARESASFTAMSIFAGATPG